MTQTVEEAEELIQLAEKHKSKTTNWSSERFNAARLALTPFLHEPLFIESNRLAPYTPRGADVNVVLDLMIHDIDIIQSIVNSPIRKLMRKVRLCCRLRLILQTHASLLKAAVLPM